MRRQARALEIVDVPSVTHLLPPEALDAGKMAPGSYVAVCGSRVIPAPMVESGNGSYCQAVVRSPLRGPGCAMSPHPDLDWAGPQLAPSLPPLSTATS